MPGYPLPQPRESKPKTSPSVYAVIGALGLVLALVGGTVVYRNAAATAAQEIPPPAPTASAKPGLAVELNQRTNTASIGTLETMLPGAPWICSPEPAPVKDWLSTSLECQVSVHKNYDGKGSSWVGTLGLGIAEEQYIVPGDAALTVEKLFTQRLNRFYGNQGLVIKNKKVTTLKGMPDSLSAVAIQADLDIDMAKLPTDYDRATMIAFELPDDAGFGVWYAERPNDAEAKAREQLQLALDSVRYS